MKEEWWVLWDKMCQEGCDDVLQVKDRVVVRKKDARDVMSMTTIVYLLDLLFDTRSRCCERNG